MTIEPNANVGTWWGYGFTDEQVYLIRLRAQRIRKRAMRGAHDGNIQAKRTHAKRLARTFIRRIKKRRIGGQDRQILSVTAKPSRLAAGMFPEREKQWRPILKREKSAKYDIVLKDFSFIASPQSTMKAFNKICAVEATGIGALLHFDDECCLDVGAFLVLAAIRPDLYPVFNGGRLSVDTREALEAVGLRQELGFDFRPSQKSKEFWPFRIRARRPAGTSQSKTRHLDVQTFEDVAKDLRVCVDEWLDLAAKQRLNSEGARTVIKIVGEVLDNAERHSDFAGQDGDWSIAGYLRQKYVEGKPIYSFNLAFLSVGDTIAETLEQAHPEVLAAAHDYASEHKKYFGREHLMSVYAVQDRVTCDHQKYTENRGGTGLLDIIDLFSNLSGASAGLSNGAMAIVSGKSCLILDDSVLKGKDLSGGGDARYLWLNDENLKSMSPSNRNVIELPHKLNGTLVSMTFDLDRVYLESSL